ncbi:MAG: anhydro-N-acetylmuramic acid kinase [Pseudomonadota bacterium]|nr:anhydro-N-acetylmuramic acid kinase [Pseudomonadota bacterium]
MAELFIGLMSGTSMDGVDGTLVEFGGSEGQLSITVRAHVHRPFSLEFAHELLALNTPGSNELHRAAVAGNALASLYAGVVNDLLTSGHVAPAEVIAVGAHGQTVRHCPGEFDGVGYTLQLNNPALLAERTGIDVIADFRSRDVAAGGQGAPLVPAFHRAAFGQPGETVAVLNIGGISNLSVIEKDGATVGFDCGPGNVLMDHWCQLHRGEAYDRNGAWAASGTVDPTLLTAMQHDAYFALPPPKSTGRDLFNSIWLDRCLRQAVSASTVTSKDVQASLAELTAWCCEQSVLRHAPDATRLLVCGGGAYNGNLMHRLAARLTNLQVESTARHGLPADQVEAVAFAWLARAWVHRHAGNVPAATGALGSRVLGALYPAA